MTIVYSKTVRQIVDDTLRLCGDFRGAGRNGRDYSWAEARDAVKACVLQLAVETGLLKDTRVIPLVLGQAVYDLPVDCLGIVSISLNGLQTGRLILPASLASLDYAGVGVSDAGDPWGFYRSTLAFNQVAVVPTAGVSGSSFTATGDGPVIRSVSDGDDVLPFDGEDPLAAVTGGVFSAGGDGGLLVGLWPTAGNLVVVYHRTPDFPDLPSGTIDRHIPYHVAAKIKYGAAERLLKNSKVSFHQAKASVFGRWWRDVVRMGVGVATRRGNVDDMRPL